MNIDMIHKSGKKLISFVIPCYHSEGSVGLVIDEIRQVVSERPDFTYQIIAVNDCTICSKSSKERRRMIRRSSPLTWPKTAGGTTR